MTYQEKILALEIENARMKMALKELEIPYLAFTPKEMPRSPEVIIREVLIDTAPSDIMGQLKKVRFALDSIYNRFNGAPGTTSKELEYALAILKDLGV